MQRLFLIVCVLFTATCYADEAVEQTPTAPSGIKLPVPERIDAPPVVEPATMITDLNAGELYVIESTVDPCLVVDSRQGIVSIKHLTGPVTFFSKFVDGKVREVEEERVYTGPDIYVVRAVQKGNIELLIIPKGTTNNEDIQRRILNVMGQTPNPPPGPGPTPGPTPPGPEPGPDPPPIPADGKRVLIIYESADAAQLTADQTAAINGVDFRAYLARATSKGPDGVTPEYRIWDKDVSLTNVSDTWKKAMALPRTALPWLVVSYGVNG